MLTPEEFKASWQLIDDNLIRCERKQVEGLGLAQSTLDFLMIAGLPDAAAPYLSFDYLAKDRIRSVSEVFDVSPKLSDYKAIGFDGSGSPICIEPGCGDRIVCLDHSANFKPVFTNASIHQLAETLLAFLHFTETVRAVHGEHLAYDEAFTDEQFNSLAQQINAIDEEALLEGNFWQQALKTLLANRNYYQQERENKGN